MKHASAVVVVAILATSGCSAGPPSGAIAKLNTEGAGARLQPVPSSR